MKGSKISQYLKELKESYPKLAPKYTRSKSWKDVLFKADYDHVEKPNTVDEDEGEEEDSGGTDTEEGSQCKHCDQSKIVRRKPRDMRVHYGLSHLVIK